MFVRLCECQVALLLILDKGFSLESPDLIRSAGICALIASSLRAFLLLLDLVRLMTLVTVVVRLSFASANVFALSIPGADCYLPHSQEVNSGGF